MQVKNIVGANTLRNVKVYLMDGISSIKVPNVTIRNFFILENDPDFKSYAKKKRPLRLFFELVCAETIVAIMPRMKADAILIFY